MQIITTQNNHRVVQHAEGYSRLCGKCGGTGIYWKRVADSVLTDTTAVAEDCFPCHGTGFKGKIFSDATSIDKAIESAKKARARREQKEEAERAVRAQAEAEKSELARQEREAEIAKWSLLAGEVGEKVSVTGTVAVLTSVETQYGSSLLVIIETAEHQAVKLFTTAGWAYALERGQEVSIVGTIKSFGEYNGYPQTQLVRPKLA